VSEPEARPRCRWTAAAWIAAAATLALLRYRGRIGVVRSLHAWIARQGVPDWARQLDNDLLLVAAGAACWLLMRRSGGGASQGLRCDLGLDRGFARGAAVGLVIAAPMLLLGALSGGGFTADASLLRGAVVAPFAEEWFFRGVLVLACTRLCATRFWPTAVAGGILFGLGHVPWTPAGLAGGWATLLVTGAGGVWYAWLARAWSRNLFVAATTHGLMNLAWTWYAGTGGAAGGPWLAEAGRGAAIALGTVLTLRPGWFRMAWARRA